MWPSRGVAKTCWTQDRKKVKSSVGLGRRDIPIGRQAANPLQERLVFGIVARAPVRAARMRQTAGLRGERLQQQPAGFGVGRVDQFRHDVEVATRLLDGPPGVGGRRFQAEPHAAWSATCDTSRTRPFRHRAAAIGHEHLLDGVPIGRRCRQRSGTRPCAEAGACAARGSADTLASVDRPKAKPTNAAVSTPITHAGRRDMSCLAPTMAISPTRVPRGC